MRRFIISLGGISLFLIVLASISFAKIDPETAVGVWLMEEGGGNTTADSSGKDHEGQLNGAKWVDGKFGKALEFKGGQWVSIPSTPELQIGDQLTMMAWFFATDIKDWRQLIAKSDEYLLRIDPPQEGNRMSAFATYDSKAKNEHLKVYVDGVQSGVSARPGKVTATGNDVEIGRWGGGSFFVGTIDEAAIFNVVLEEADIQTIMDKGLEDALGGLAVSPKDKLATRWGKIKAQVNN